MTATRIEVLMDLRSVVFGKSRFYLMIFLLISFYVSPPSILAQSNQVELIRRFKTPQFQVLALDINNANVLAAGTRRGDIHFWDLKQRKFLKTISYFEKRPPEPLTDTGIRFKEELGLDPRRKPVYDLDFSPTRPSQLAALYSKVGNVRLWDILNSSLLIDKRFVSARSIAFAHQGVFLAIGRKGGRPDVGLKGLQVFNVNSKKIHRTLGETLPVHHDVLAFTPKGTPGGIMLASGGRDGVVRVWKISNRKRVLTIKAHQTGSQVNPGGLHAISFGPKGRKLATAGGDETVRVWSVPDGKQLARFSFPSDPWNVAFSPTGSVLAATHSDTVVLFSTESWERRAAWNVQNDVINDLAFSFNGKFVAVGGGNAGSKDQSDFSVTVWKNPFFEPGPPGRGNPPPGNPGPPSGQQGDNNP